MANKVSARTIAAAVLLAFTAAGSILYHFRQERKGMGNPGSVAALPNPTERKEPSSREPGVSQPPRLAFELLVPSAAASTKQSQDDQFFADERRIMAKTWGLNNAQSLELERAVEAGVVEFKDLMARLTLLCHRPLVGRNLGA